MTITMQQLINVNHKWIANNQVKLNKLQKLKHISKEQQLLLALTHKEANEGLTTKDYRQLKALIDLQKQLDNVRKAKKQFLHIQRRQINLQKSRVVQLLVDAKLVNKKTYQLNFAEQEITTGLVKLVHELQQKNEFDNDVPF